MAVTAKQIATGAGGTGSSGAGIILLDMLLKAHGKPPLQPEEAVAVMTIVSPVATVVFAVLMALLTKLLGWLHIMVPGVNEPADAPSATTAVPATPPAA